MKITEIIVHPLRMPLVHPYVLSKAYGVLVASDQIYIEIKTDEGITGWGEGNPWAGFSGDIAESVVCVLQKLVAPALIGKDPTNINAIHQELNGLIAGNKMVKAAIDMACYDILGKALGAPVHKILGGKKYDSIKCFWSIGGSTPAESAAEVLSVKEKGYWGCMIKIGTDYKNDIARTLAVRDAVGPDFPLIADANQGWDYDTALRYGRGVKDADLLFYEQPVKAWDVASLAKLRRNLSMPISADEGVSTIQEAMTLVKSEACDVFSIKPSKQGGIMPTKQICEYATENGILLFFNSMIEGGVTQAASLNIAATCDIMMTTGHSYFSTLRHKDDVTDFGTLVKNGITAIPEQPGLGVTVFEDKVKQYESDCVIIK
ncbi:MAG: hypothetical protein IJM92_04540 [Fibrobacter sp.]|uniref:mandelate racemase/muconate lactonizing enzyme family protein n=1 Tax=Fibrobacter sp. TaxID=35828 RepID=UPI0025C6D2AE|nr:enolase C-terminal domain-like protein [Fibrobacter sp.]MBQ3719878.1 hypothetical protein [Fibrobacter sp.]MBQ7078930.1 hypothetical protein [Fibrobacter sp.]